MSNMSYCRFQNTSNDLQDCIDAIEEMNNNNGRNGYDEPLSNDEQEAFRSMIEMCRTYLEFSEELLDTIDNDETYND